MFGVALNQLEQLQYRSRPTVPVLQSWNAKRIPKTATETPPQVSESKVVAAKESELKNKVSEEAATKLAAVERGRQERGRQERGRQERGRQERGRQERVRQEQVRQEQVRQEMPKILEDLDKEILNCTNKDCLNAWYKKIKDKPNVLDKEFETAKYNEGKIELTDAGEKIKKNILMPYFRRKSAKEGVDETIYDETCKQMLLLTDLILTEGCMKLSVKEVKAKLNDTRECSKPLRDTYDKLTMRKSRWSQDLFGRDAGKTILVELQASKDFDKEGTPITEKWGIIKLSVKRKDLLKTFLENFAKIPALKFNETKLLMKKGEQVAAAGTAKAKAAAGAAKAKAAAAAEAAKAKATAAAEAAKAKAAGVAKAKAAKAKAAAAAGTAKAAAAAAAAAAGTVVVGNKIATGAAVVGKGYPVLRGEFDPYKYEKIVCAILQHATFENDSTLKSLTKNFKCNS